MANCNPSNPDGFLRPDGGVVTDSQCVNEHCENAAKAGRGEWPMPPLFWYMHAAVHACDLPFSAVTDTLLLPITVPYTLLSPQALTGFPNAKPINPPDGPVLNLPITASRFDFSVPPFSEMERTAAKVP